MAQYFVDIEQDRLLFTDRDGVNVGEATDLRIEVCRQIGEVVRDCVPARSKMSLGINVRDGSGASVMRGSLRLDLTAFRG